MADKAGDRSRRTTADKERSRQLSRPVSGKSAGGGSGRPNRSQGAQRGAAARRAAQSAAAKQGQGSGRGGKRGGRGASGRGGKARPGRSRTALFTWGAIGLVVIVVAVVVIVSQLGKSTTSSITYDPAPVPATVLHEITHVPSSVYDKVGTGISGSISAPRVQTGQPPLKYQGKPGVFSLLGEFCPFCAAERWALITSLSRFGTFSGLKTMQSSPVDVYPKTQTYTFNTTTYTSRYLSANLLEMYGQDKATGKHAVINKPTKSDVALISKYDHGSSTSSGTIPFTDFGNKVIISGASYSPSPLQGLSRATIAASLSDPSSPVTKLIIGTSNYMSAAVCAIDGGKPGSVCKSSGVQAAAKALTLSF